MKLLETIQYQILAYIDHQISLQDLRAWLAPRTMSAIDPNDAQSQRLAMQLIGDFSDFDENFLTEPELRNKLFNIVAPFASSSTTYNLGLDEYGGFATTETRTSVVEEQVAA
jgi:hypothetical protein